jgi:CBS domain-containing protein
MTAGVITVATTASLAEIAKLLEQHRFKRVPVMEGSKLVGIVTRGDLLQVLTAADAARPASVDDRAIRERLLPCSKPSAGRICSTRVSSCGTASLTSRGSWRVRTNATLGG